VSLSSYSAATAERPQRLGVSSIVQKIIVRANTSIMIARAIGIQQVPADMSGLATDGCWFAGWIATR